MSNRGSRVGVFQGMRTRVLQNDDGQIAETHSVSAGLDYAGIGPEHVYLHEIGRVQYTSATDKEALQAFHTLCAHGRNYPGARVVARSCRGHQTRAATFKRLHPAGQPQRPRRQRFEYSHARRKRLKRRRGSSNRSRRNSTVPNLARVRRARSPRDLSCSRRVEMPGD